MFWASYWWHRHLISCRFKKDNCDFLQYKICQVSITGLNVRGRGCVIQQRTFFIVTEICALEMTSKFRCMISRSLADKDGSLFHVKTFSTHCQMPCLQQKEKVILKNMSQKAQTRHANILMLTKLNANNFFENEPKIKSLKTI